MTGSVGIISLLFVFMMFNFYFLVFVCLFSCWLFLFVCPAWHRGFLHLFLEMIFCAKHSAQLLAFKKLSVEKC